MTDEPKTKNEDATKPRTFTEELTVAGSQLLERLQEIIQQGNIRRIIIRDQSGRTILEVPLTLGVVGGATAVIFAPFFAAVGAIAALVARVNIHIERYEDPKDADAEKSGPSVVDLSDESQ